MARWRAGSLMIAAPAARGPKASREDAAEDGWRRAVILMSSSTSAELVDPALTPETLLFRLFHEDGRARLSRAARSRRDCRCSRERVETVLRMLPGDELQAMKVDGRVVVTCQFCSARYDFDDAELHALVDT